MDDLFKPQLADEKVVPVTDLDQFLNSDHWAMEQKLDGHRVLIHVIDGQPIPVSRKGEVRRVPDHVFDAFHTTSFMGHWAFDGELLDGFFHVYDLPLVPKLITPGDRYFERRRVLDNLFTMFKAEGVRLLPWSLSVMEKVTLVGAVKAMNGEGLMLKRLDGLYHPGKRTEAMLKCKFRSEIDCVVKELKRHGKDNMVLVVYRDGEEVEVGECTALAGDGPKIQVGDVVCVTYLYATADNRLFQPTLPRIRTDKDPKDCTFDQLKYTNKKVVA